MSKTVQEIMEVMGKTVEASVALERKNGSSYTHIADINPEDINEARYYFDGALYRSVMRCLELKLKNNWTAKAKKGLLLDGFNIKVTHPEGDSVTIGYGGFYIAEEPEYDAAQNLTSIIAYDELYPSMQAYDMSLDWTNGISLKNYLIAILNKLGINYDVQSLNLMANADKVITSEKFLDIENDSTESAYTYRDVLDEIAKAAGVTFAFHNSLRGDEYKLYAIKPTESGYVIDESNLRSVTIGAKYGPVKGVVLSREPQEDNVFYPSNLTDSQTAVKISNVEIMEDAKDNDYRENFIEGIYNSVKNTEYYLYELDSFGMAFLNFGDIFTIKTADRENGIIGEEKEYKTIFMRTDMTIGNGIKEKSKLEAPQATSTDYSAAKSSTEKMLKWTMLRVDKQNQRIESYITDNDNRYTKITQTLEGLDVAINDKKNGLKAQMTATAEKAKSAYSMASTVINAGYTTTDDVNTLIAQSANDITLSVERNLKIGARNILLDSARFGSFTPIGEQADVKVTPFDDPAVPSGVYSNVRFNSQINGTVDFYYSAADILQSLKKIKVSTTYTLSFFARYKSGIDDITDFAPKSVISAGSATVTYDNDRCTTPKLSTAWQRYILTFKLTGTVSDFRLRFLFNNCKSTDVSAFQLSSLKLEEGNVATDWSPSAEDIDQSVKAQISMCVQKDKDNNLVSEINITSNKLTINTDNFTLDKTGKMTCTGATITGGILTCGDESYNMTITTARLIHTIEDEEIGRIGVAIDRSGNVSELIKGTNSVSIGAGESALFEFDSNGAINNGASNGVLSHGTDIFCGYRHFRKFGDYTDSNYKVFQCGTGIYADKSLGVEMYDCMLNQINCAIKIKRNDNAIVSIYGVRESLNSPALTLGSTDGYLYYNGNKLAFTNKGVTSFPDAIGMSSSQSYVYVVADKNTGKIGYLSA